jgi:hypothetical protein
LVTFLESRGEHILWATHIPAFLRIPDPSVQITLTPEYRPGINLYRAKSDISPRRSVWQEYLSLLTPLFLHFGFWSRNTM